MRVFLAIVIIASYILGISTVVNNVNSSENHSSFIHGVGSYTIEVPVYKVSATVYNAVKGQTDTNPFITADGTDVRKYKRRILSISQDMLKRNGGSFNFGDSVSISGTDNLDGIWFVHDVMHEKYRRTIDMLVASDIKTGKWHKIVISRVIEKSYK